MILLDTHALIWLDQGNARLGRQARERADAALQQGVLAVSSITFWEIGMLLNKNRLHFEVNPLAWRNDLLHSGLMEIPVDGVIALHSTQLDAFHGDPADRLITATAAEHSATIITADEKILDWGGPIGRFDARM